MKSPEDLWATIGKAHARRSPERREVALSDALNPVIEHGGPTTTATLWAVACRFPAVATLRALGFHLARRDGLNSLDDVALAWLLSQPTDDLSSLINGLSAIENAIAEREALPPVAGLWIASYATRCLGESWAVAFSALGVVHHLVAGGTLKSVVTDAAGKAMLPLLERLRREASDDETAEIERVRMALVQPLPLYLAPDPAVASALQTATAEYEAFALPDEVVTVLRGCATDIERDLDRLIHAATTGDPGVEVHIIGRDEMDGISLSLDQRVRRFLARLYDSIFGNASELMVYNVAPASYTLGVRASESDATRAFGERLTSLLAVIHRSLEADETAALEGLDATSRIALVELIETLSAQRLGLRVVLFDPSQATWTRQMTLDVRKPSRAQRQAMVGGGEVRHPLWVASNDVPQANTLGRVITLLEAVCEGRSLEPEALGLDARDVTYYRRAAQLLGLLDDDRAPTDRGWTLVALRNDPAARLRALAGWFEGSVVARAWMRWAKVDLLAALDPLSAEKFLTERGVGLSADTIGRRAKTLTAWVRELAPHHYANSRDATSPPVNSSQPGP